MVKSLAAKSDNQIETYAFVEIFINFRSLLINANFGPTHWLGRYFKKMVIGHEHGWKME